MTHNIKLFHTYAHSYTSHSYACLGHYSIYVFCTVYLQENQTGITLITEYIKRLSLLVYKRRHLLLSNVWIYHLSPCNFSTHHLMNLGTMLSCYFQRIIILVLDCSAHTGQDGGTQICLPQITWIDLYSCAKQSNHPEIIVYLPIIYEHLSWHIREQ